MPIYDVCAHVLSAVVPTVKTEDAVTVDVRMFRVTRLPNPLGAICDVSNKHVHSDHENSDVASLTNQALLQP